MKYSAKLKYDITYTTRNAQSVAIMKVMYLLAPPEIEVLQALISTTDSQQLIIIVKQERTEIKESPSWISSS